MIVIKNKISIGKMEEAGKRLSSIFETVDGQAIEGKSTLTVDAWIEAQLAKLGLESRTKGYRSYRHASCISINNELVHGIPSEKKMIKSGDIVKIDICASWRGYCADMARMVIVGKVPSKVSDFVDVAQQSLDAGIAQAVAGGRLSNISAAIQQKIEEHGYGVVRDFAGHGIGKRMHEEPEILNYGHPGQGPLLREGMTFAIEPMLTMGSYEVDVMDDGWTVKTRDGNLAGHIEDTVLITDGMPKILTRPH